MQALEKNIKGFNILEVVIVLVIIGIISAAALPNFSSWKRDRGTRGAAVKIKDLLTNIVSQVQRGHYAFVQVHVVEEKDDEKLVIVSKGLGIDKYTYRMRNVANWKTDYSVRCKPNPDVADGEDADSSWDDEGGVSDKLEVSKIEFTNVKTEFVDSYGTVCFSKDGTWYSSDGKFKNTPDEVISGFRICEASTDSPICKSKTDGSPDPEHENVYEISWSRFGNIIYEKWKAPKEGCASCEGEWILQ